MEIGRTPPVPKQMVKTEWAEDPSAAPPPKEAPVQKGIGEELNHMAGLDTRPNYFKENKKLDKDAFLKMFMEQLKFQDPTKPVDNEKVAQQMAMFSQLEQQMLTNKNLEKMIAGQQNTHLMALNLMGKEIAVDRLTIQHEKSLTSTINFKLPQEAANVRVKVLDEGGQEVDVIDVGSRPEGTVETKWLGSTKEGRPAESGRYLYSVEATDAKGGAIAVESKLTGKVTGVSSANGKTLVHVGDQKIDLMEVSVVKEATVEAPKLVNPGVGDKNNVGTKSETTVPENAAASKGLAPETEISSDVVKQLMGEQEEERPQIEDMSDLLNPVMPIFTR